MPSETISIALCTYNGARYLDEQLRSIAVQTRLPDEVILCDDGSTDNTLQVAEDFARDVPFRVNITSNTQRLGSTKNFERAIRLCRGSLIFLCDQDDIWLPHKLETLEAIFENQPELDAAFTNASIVDDRLNDLGYDLWTSIGFSKRERQAIETNGAFQVLLRHNVATGATMVFRSRWLEIVLPICEWGVHDAWIALLIAAMGNIRPVEASLILYRQHEGSQIGARRRGTIDRIRHARQTSTSHTLHALRQIEAAIARIAAANPPPHGKTAEELEAKRRHLEVRLRLINRIPGGMRDAFADLAAGRYHRYSMGWRSLAHDVIKITA